MMPDIICTAHETLRQASWLTLSQDIRRGVSQSHGTT